MSSRFRLGILALLPFALAGCGPDLDPQERQGRALIRDYGCGSCHVVPGVRVARGVSGPPLIHFRNRVLIAGRLPNERSNLVRWIMDPQQVDSGTAMPDLDVGAEHAAAIAAYLYTIR